MAGWRVNHAGDSQSLRRQPDPLGSEQPASVTSNLQEEIPSIFLEKSLRGRSLPLSNRTWSKRSLLREQVARLLVVED